MCNASLKFKFIEYKGSNALEFEPLCSKISFGGSMEKVVGPVFVCMSACPSVRAFSPLEPERLVGSGRANIHSMRRDGGKTMATVSDRSVERGTCLERSRKALHKM